MTKGFFGRGCARGMGVGAIDGKSTNRKAAQHRHTVIACCSSESLNLADNLEDYTPLPRVNIRLYKQK